MLGSIAALITSLGIKQVKDPQNRIRYSLTFGVFIHIFVFGKTTIISFGTVLVSYLLMKFIRGDRQHICVFIFTSIILSSAQLHKMLYYYGRNDLDLAMTLMMMYTRLTSVSINYKDGYLMTN